MANNSGVAFSLLFSIDKLAFLTLFEYILPVSLTVKQYKSKCVHVPKNTHFSDYWLRTSVVIHVYKARARRNGYRMFISVYILCYTEVMAQDDTVTLNEITPHFQLLPMSKVDQSVLRIHEMPPLQYPKSHIIRLFFSKKKVL